jgi:hypothetical protein
MWPIIEKIDAWIKGFVDKTEYVFKIVKWGFETLRAISDCLSRFPRPAVKAAEPGKENIGVERSGQSAVSDAESTSDKPSV